MATKAKKRGKREGFISFVIYKRELFLDFKRRGPQYLK